MIHAAAVPVKNTRNVAEANKRQWLRQLLFNGKALSVYCMRTLLLWTLAIDHRRGVEAGGHVPFGNEHHADKARGTWLFVD